MRDVRQHVHLEVGCERVGQAHVAREGAEDEVAHLDAVGRNDVAEGIVVVTQELREVMKQDQQYAQSTLERDLFDIYYQVQEVGLWC